MKLMPRLAAADTYRLSGDGAKQGSSLGARSLHTERTSRPTPRCRKGRIAGQPHDVFEMDNLMKYGDGNSKATVAVSFTCSENSEEAGWPSHTYRSG